MTTHELKCWREPFQAVLDRQKHHEVRRADRDFKVGDFLELREWAFDVAKNGVDAPGQYTGRSLRARITYVTAGATFDLPADLCVLSIVVESTGQPCSNHSPSWFTGRWRDWHRGHRCDKDDGDPRTPEGQAEIERGGRA